jgi:peptidoglycan/LPS O-acetylase OafA/YrhL
VSPVPPDIDASRRFVLGYRPPLDGVRGFALISIMVFHSFLNTSHPVPVPGSFVSVDMFFALSGFLITTILAQEWLAKGRIDLLAFYIRRALRLFPALIVFLGLMAVLSYLDVLAGNVGLMRRQIVWTALYGQNWHEVFSPGFTALSHAWTLSVEEQFYVLWPLILWGLLALRRSRVLTVGLVVGLAAISATVRAPTACYSVRRSGSPLHSGSSRTPEGAGRRSSAGSAPPTSWSASPCSTCRIEPSTRVACTRPRGSRPS